MSSLKIAEQLATDSDVAPKVESVPAWRLEYLAKRKALAELMEAHKVTVESERVDARPDGDTWNKDSSHAAFRVLHNGRFAFKGHYSAGSLASLPDDLKAYRAAYTKGLKGKRFIDGEFMPVAVSQTVRKAWEKRQAGNYTIDESKVAEIVRRAWLPESVDVIQSLLSDATEESFDEWCRNFGYDTDSRKALAMWETCREIDRVMRRCFGAYYESAQEIAREF